MVSRLVRVQETSGSNPDTSTKKKTAIWAVFFFILWKVSKSLIEINVIQNEVMPASLRMPAFEIKGSYLMNRPTMRILLPTVQTASTLPMPSSMVHRIDVDRVSS